MSTVSDSAWKKFILYQPISRIVNIFWANKESEFLNNNVLSLNPINERSHKMF